jgi:hypothetical protein
LINGPFLYNPQPLQLKEAASQMRHDVRTPKRVKAMKMNIFLNRNVEQIVGHLIGSKKTPEFRIFLGSPRYIDIGCVPILP